MAQPVEPVKWVKTMKPKLSIEVRVNVASVITALSGFVFTIAYIAHYF